MHISTLFYARALAGFNIFLYLCTKFWIKAAVSVMAITDLLMKKTIFTMMMLLAMSTIASAQAVDRAKVVDKAKEAEKAQADLKKVDTGEKPWKFEGVLGLNAAATGLVNWSAGGNNTINGVAYTRLRLLYHGHNVAWDTNLDMEYGMSWIDQPYDDFQKSNDKIKLATKLGWEFQKAWYLTVLAGFQTQFAPGKTYDGTAAPDPIISKFFAPAYTDISVGIDWKPNDMFSVYISPIAGRVTTVIVSESMNNYFGQQYNDNYPDTELAKKYTTDNDVKAKYGASGLELALKEKYGVWRYDTDNWGNIREDYGHPSRAELGLNLRGSVNYTYKDLKIMSTLGLYTPYAWGKVKMYQDANGKIYAADKKEDKYAVDPAYTYLGYKDQNRRFGNFDVDWTTAISYQFLKCLQVTLSTDLRYYNGVLIDKTCKAKSVEDCSQYVEGETHTHAGERVQFKGVIGIGVGYSF